MSSMVFCFAFQHAKLFSFIALTLLLLLTLMEEEESAIGWDSMCETLGMLFFNSKYQ